MNIQPVKSFKTSDSRIFEDKGEAIKHEYSVSLRGLIQRNSGNRISDSYTAAQIAEILVKNVDELIKIQSTFKHEMAMYKRYLPKTPQAPVKTKLEMLVASKN
jgi:hypothetical protein